VTVTPRRRRARLTQFLPLIVQRRTIDLQDAQWLCQPLEAGPLRASHRGRSGRLAAHGMNSVVIGDESGQAVDERHFAGQVGDP
jgi:hypothetical protein